MIRLTASKPYVAAVVTDLHLGDAAAQTRMNSLTTKLSGLRGNARALFLCGDTFTLSAKDHWDALINGPADPAMMETLKETSRSLADRYYPLIIEASKDAGISKICMIPGNGDAIAYRQIQDKRPDQDVILADRRFIPGYERMPFNLLGLGSIEPDCEDARKITVNNPWYKGVMRKEEYASYLRNIGIPASSCQNSALNVLMTHAPAFGHLDSFSGQESIGSKTLLDFITRHRPLLHICGHVHSGCYTGENWDYTPFSVIGGHTLSINPGGGDNHDYDEGVLMMTVELGALADARLNRTLETEAPHLARPVL